MSANASLTYISADGTIVRGEQAQQLARARSQGASLVRTASAREVRSNINEEIRGMLEPLLVWVFILFQLAEIIVSIVILKLSWDVETSQPLKTWLIVWICVRGFPLLFSVLGKAFPSTQPPASASSSSTPAGASAPAAAAPASGASDQQQDSTAGGPSESQGCSCKKAFENLAGLFALAWWIYGIVLVSRCEGCKESAYMLWTLCVVLISLTGALVGLLLAIPVPCASAFLACCRYCFSLPASPSYPERQPATRPQLDSLPKMPFTPDLVSEEDASCVMCLEAYEPGVELRQLPCRHYFHRKCIDNWLTIKCTCPLCRQDISLQPSASLAV
eukprot:tig00000950_g5769.t1